MLIWDLVKLSLFRSTKVAATSLHKPGVKLFIFKIFDLCFHAECKGAAAFVHDVPHFVFACRADFRAMQGINWISFSFFGSRSKHLSRWERMK